MNRRVSRRRAGRFGSGLVLAGVSLLALATIVYSPVPAAAQSAPFPELSNVTLMCAAGGQFRLQGTATCDGCPAGEVVWHTDCSPSGCEAPNLVASGPFPVNFDMTSAFLDDDPSIWVAAHYPTATGYQSTDAIELVKPGCDLVIAKAATPEDATSFPFACTVHEIDRPHLACDFNLRSGEAHEVVNQGDQVVIRELLPQGWRLENVVCTGAAASWRFDGTSLTTTYPDGLVCTFHNSAYGHVVVRKVVAADAPAATFTFDPSWAANFTLGGNEQTMAIEVPAGLHSVAEVELPAGWSQASASCSDGSSPSAIGVSPGETVTCTFNNRYEAVGGSLLIIKRTTPAGGTGFGFDGTLGPFTLDDGGSQLFDDLAAGEYAVTETPPAGWEFEDVVCYTAPGAAVDYEVVGSGVVVNLAEGQDVICKFANREEDTGGPEGSLTIIKQTVPAGGTGFEFDAGALGTFSLDDGGSETFTDLAAVAYVVTETPAADWEFASVTCDALDFVVDGASVTVNLAEGEAAVCTFTNGELPYTGSSAFLPLLLAGLVTLLAGMGTWVTGLIRQTKA